MIHFFNSKYTGIFSKLCIFNFDSCSYILFLIALSFNFVYYFYIINIAFNFFPYTAREVKTFFYRSSGSSAWGHSNSHPLLFFNFFFFIFFPFISFFPSFSKHIQWLCSFFIKVTLMNWECFLNDWITVIFKLRFLYIFFFFT